MGLKNNLICCGNYRRINILKIKNTKKVFFDSHFVYIIIQRVEDPADRRRFLYARLVLQGGALRWHAPSQRTRG